MFKKSCILIGFSISGYRQNEECLQNAQVCITVLKTTKCQGSIEIIASSHLTGGAFREGHFVDTDDFRGKMIFVPLYGKKETILF